MRTFPVEIAGLVMLLGRIASLLLLGRIAPLLSFCRRSIRVRRPLLNCPLLVLDRSFLSVRPRVIPGCHLWLVARVVAR